MNPVIVGVGQIANKDPERIVHPVELIEEAARLAFDDAGADVRPHLGTVCSAPLSIFSEEHAGAMAAERLGLPSGPRLQSRYSGAGPQHHLGQVCREIAAGQLDGALLLGGIADASVRNAKRLGVTPPAPPTSIWSQGSDGVGRERPDGDWKQPLNAEGGAGCQLPSAIFAIVESALGAAAGLDPDAHRAALGRLLAPFTDVAATRPDFAWFPQRRDASEIATPSATNRLVAEPFTKLMCSFPTIDQAAAVVVVSEALADRLGIPSAARVHPWSVASAKEHGAPSSWPVMHRSEAYALAAATACELAGIDPADISSFDLYSCFPAAVQLGMAAFGLDAADQRPRTVTGGLPYFGGPGASYATHAIACMVEACRATGGVGAVGALGGFVHDFAVGIYGPEPPEVPFRWEDELRPSYAPVTLHPTAHAEGVVVAGTVLHERTGAVEAGVIVQLDDGSRVGARAGDRDLPAAVSGTTLVGRTVRVIEKVGAAWWEPR